MTSLIFLETAEQAHWLAAHSAQFPAHHWRPFAATPEAVFACQSLGLQYTILETHAAVGKRRVEYEPVLERFLEWRSMVDAWARHRIPEFGRTEFRPAECASFNLQRVHAEIWAIARSLAEFFDAEKPESIALWPPIIENISLQLQPMIAPVVMLASDVAWQRGIPIIDLTGEQPGLTPIAGEIVRRPSALAWLKQRLLRSNIRAAVAAARSGSIGDVLRVFVRTGSIRGRVLACGFGYDLQRVVMQLRRSGFVVDQLGEHESSRIPDAISTRIGAAADDLLAEPGVWDIVEACGVGRATLWALILRRWWCGLVPVHWVAYLDSVRRFRSRRFEALVVNNVGDDGLGGPMVAAARTAGVRSYLYQHGGSCDVDSRSLHSYVSDPDVFLAYGDGTVRDFAETVLPFVSRRSLIQPVGSATLDEIRAKGRTNKHLALRRRLQGDDARPLVLYVPTHFGGYGRLTGHDLSAHPPTAYFELMQRVLRLWTSAAGVRLVYKDFIVANDRTRVVPEMLARELPDAVVTNVPLRELMWAVDAIVVDHVTTAALEVLVTDAPCVFYLPSTTPRAARARALLARTARVEQTGDGFMDAVRELLVASAFTPLANRDQSFLRAYGTYGDDNQSAVRAARIIALGAEEKAG